MECNHKRHPSGRADRLIGHVVVLQYARDLIDWAAALKSIDPGLLIGANGPSSAQAVGDVDKEIANYVSWWQTVLTSASSSFDYLIIHSYPIWAWNYDDYVTQAYNLAVSRTAPDTLFFLISFLRVYGFFPLLFICFFALLRVDACDNQAHNLALKPFLSHNPVLCCVCWFNSLSFFSPVFPFFHPTIMTTNSTNS